MITSTSCMLCQLNSHMESVKDYKEEDRKKFIKGCIKLFIEYGDSESTPWIGVKINELKKDIFQTGDLYSKDKEHFNELALSLEDRLEKEINRAADPLKKAVSYALIGNYIDFDAVKDISDDKLFNLINDEKMSKVDEDTYQNFICDLKNARRLVYLMDNCGEIVFDKLLIKTMIKYNNNLEVTAVARGAYVVNDVTVEDAKFVGLDKVCRVIGNGSAAASTLYSEINEETRNVIKAADLLIAKGQGNLEGFHGGGFNTYYMFLVKCDYFCKKFSMEKFSPVFRNEKDFNL